MKGRPTSHPVIVHIAGARAIDDWAADVPATAYALAEAFWPGPLTIVVPRASHVSAAITGGQQTVALRAPAHPLFQQVLDELATSQQPSPGIAAPSANRFGRVSPTTPAHVATELDQYLGVNDLILDGGECTVGVESTIAVCRKDDVVVARAGGVTADQLAQVVRVAPVESDATTPRVPGSLAAHYSPSAQVTLVTDDRQLRAISDELTLNADVGVVCLASDLHATPPHWVRLATPNSVDDYARELYAALRRGDELGLTRIVALAPPARGIGVAIRDRLQRASV